MVFAHNAIRQNQTHSWYALIIQIKWCWVVAFINIQQWICCANKAISIPKCRLLQTRSQFTISNSSGLCMCALIVTLTGTHTLRIFNNYFQKEKNISKNLATDDWPSVFNTMHIEHDKGYEQFFDECLFFILSIPLNVSWAILLPIFVVGLGKFNSLASIFLHQTHSFHQFSDMLAISSENCYYVLCK